MGGILSTDVHGTGKAWGFISESVVSMTVVDGEGTVHKCRPSDDLFRAAVGGVGAVGIITDVVIQGVPRFNVDQKTEMRDLTWVGEHLNELLESNDHLSLYIFPFADSCQVNTWNRTSEPASRWGELQEFLNISADALLAAWVGNLPAYTKLFPLARYWSRLAYLIKRGSNVVLDSDKAYNRTIYHLHQELEFTIPFEQTLLVCFRLRDLYEQLYPRGLPYA
jgi:FAD/FMN-containing dehydrogenase